MSTIIPEKPPMPAVAGVEHHHLDLPDGRMHVATLGSGDPVILLSGFAQTWWEWRDLMPALAAAGHRAIAPDLRGEGWSELPAGGLTRTRRAEDVLAMLEAFGLDRVRLVSHDMGAISALQLTLEYPDRFTSQVMLSVPPPQMRFGFDLIPGMRHLWHQEVLSTPVLGPTLLRSGALPRSMYAGFTARPLSPEVLARYLDLMRERGLVNASGRLCRRMVLPELGRIIRGTYRDSRFTMPVLYLFGDEDLGFPPHVTRRVFQEPETIGTEVHFALVEGAGHFLIDEAPEATVRLILDFFATH